MNGKTPPFAFLQMPPYLLFGRSACDQYYINTLAQHNSEGNALTVAKSIWKSLLSKVRPELSGSSYAVLVQSQRKYFFFMRRLSYRHSLPP